MLKIRSIFRRLPSVTYSRGKYHVHGSEDEILHMCVACEAELQRRGMKPLDLWQSLWMAVVESCRHTTDRLEDAQND